MTTLHIGSCPVSVVHAVADQMFWLLQFSAENIDDTSRQLDRFRFTCCWCVLKGCHIKVFVESTPNVVVVSASF